MNQISIRTGDSVTVRYDGWEPRFDELIKLNSDRLAEFFTHTSEATRRKRSPDLLFDLTEANTLRLKSLHKSLQEGNDSENCAHLSPPEK